MLTRVIQFVIGAALGAAGGYLLWTNRALAPTLFPPTASGVPWLLVLGLLVFMTGAVFLVYAVHPRPERRARLAAEAARREEMLGAADSYYSERSRAADRDWRSGDLPPTAPPQSAPEPEPVRRAAPAATPAPAPQPSAPARSATTSEQQATPFPSQATLAPIPPAAEPLPPPPAPPAPPAQPAPQKPPTPDFASLQLQPSPAPATPQPPPPTPSPPASPAPRPATPILAAMSTPPIATPPSLSTPPPSTPVRSAPPSTPAPAAPAPSAPLAQASQQDAFAKIRAAIREGRLVEADKLLTIEREKAQGVGLAELTGLAGDQAAAAGRQSNAKWLWRLALKRFGEANAMDAPAARAVAESLRLADD